MTLIITKSFIKRICKWEQRVNYVDRNTPPGWPGVAQGQAAASRIQGRGREAWPGDPGCAARRVT